MLKLVIILFVGLFINTFANQIKFALTKQLLILTLTKTELITKLCTDMVS